MRSWAVRDNPISNDYRCYIAEIGYTGNSWFLRQFYFFVSTNVPLITDIFIKKRIANEDPYIINENKKWFDFLKYVLSFLYIRDETRQSLTGKLQFRNIVTLN